MAFLDHVYACNRCDHSRYRRFLVAGTAVGWVRHDFAERLRSFPEMQVGEIAVALVAEADSFQARTEAMGRVVARLVAGGLARGNRLESLRGEMFGVYRHWGAPPLLAIDRAMVPYFGIIAYGLHVNGYVRRPDGGLSLWLARRALDRVIEPGKLDNMVAGGQPLGLTLQENLIKEAQEEAGLPQEIARRAIPVGALSYTFENEAGLKPDLLFLYDLELPVGMEPVNTDGEVDSFLLVPAEEVAAIVEKTFDFKFNCSLVVIDFLIRHGVLTPDHPEYLALIQGLRRPGMGGFSSVWEDGG